PKTAPQSPRLVAIPQGILSNQKFPHITSNPNTTIRRYSCVSIAKLKEQARQNKVKIGQRVQAKITLRSLQGLSKPHFGKETGLRNAHLFLSILMVHLPPCLKIQM
ncbi:MAG: hypothetical protein Q9164_007817, partial [Protoblastenia rupestris]